MSFSELEKIRAALGRVVVGDCFCEEQINPPCDNCKRIDEALAALSSLEAVGDGDGEKLSAILAFLHDELEDKIQARSPFKRTEAETLLSRLILKAKLTDKERVEIKRETLEEVKDFMGEAYRDTNSIYVKDAMGVLNHYIDRQLAALGKKEEGKE